MCDHDCVGCLEPCDEGDESVIEALPSKVKRGHLVDEDGFEIEEYIMFGLM